MPLNRCDPAARSLVAELVRGLPSGMVQVIDLDEPEAADPQGLVLHAEAALSPQLGGDRGGD